MANPNIAALTNYYGSTSKYNLTFGSNTQLVGNSTNSNYVYKINAITVANKSATDTGVSVYIADGSTSTTYYHIAYQIAVPPNTSMVITDKNTSFYLLENDYLRADVTTGGNSVDIIVSWESILD